MATKKATKRATKKSAKIAKKKTLRRKVKAPIVRKAKPSKTGKKRGRPVGSKNKLKHNETVSKQIIPETSELLPFGWDIKGNHFVKSTPENKNAVEHPSHYNSHPSGVEAITVLQHHNFNVGSALKYLWRAGLKGEALEDLKKAREYINFEIARVEKFESGPAK